MDMIERVARAIMMEIQFGDFGHYKDDPDYGQVYVCSGKQTDDLDNRCQKAARAAIAALREPTPEMIAAITALPVVKQIDSTAVLAATHGFEGLPDEPTALVQIWNAGINEILKE